MRWSFKKRWPVHTDLSDQKPSSWTCIHGLLCGKKIYTNNYRNYMV